MRRFRILFVVVALALLVPLAVLVERALHSVELERQMRHRAVAERIFDEMERALSSLLETEEARSPDAYAMAAGGETAPFVVGHFELDPDGAIQSSPPGAESGEIAHAVRSAWRRAPRQATQATEEVFGVAQMPGTTVGVGLGARLAAPMEEQRQQVLGRDEVSVFDALRSLNKAASERADRQRKMTDYDRPNEGGGASLRAGGAVAAAPAARKDALAGRDGLADAAPFELERVPMSGRIVDGRFVMLSRTVVRGREAYRQGVLLDVRELGDWLRTHGLGGNGLSRYAEVAFVPPSPAPPAPVADGAFAYQHRFAEPFDALSARLALRPLPGVGSVTYVYALAALLLTTGVLGLAALYRLVSVAVRYAERRSNFVAAVSHELKTPLTAIRMYGEMLRDGLVPSEAKRDEYYRHITVESERLSRLINNVLELARLEKGTREVALISGPIEPVVREVAELLRPHVESQGFELSVALDADLPPVRFEPDALMQVLWNLVDNAVKYARDSTPKRIELRARRAAGAVAVGVRDYGPGVAARHLGRIFEPFYRGENELTRRNAGTGIGLALVRGLVERMGARVSGSNRADGGFAVEITFRDLSLP